jgi:hypothetical protein
MDGVITVSITNSDVHQVFFMLILIRILKHYGRKFLLTLGITFMNKKIVSLTMSSVILCLGLTACSYFNERLSSNPPTQREQNCLELKRNLTFDLASQTEGMTNSPIREAESARLYAKYKCADFENK